MCVFLVSPLRRCTHSALVIVATVAFVRTLTGAVPNDWRKDLPEPVLSDHGDWIDMYYDAWRIADMKKVKRPSGWTFDDAFDPSGMWMWDQVWITTYGKYVQGAHNDVQNPMAGLDQFYASQDKNSGYMSHVWPRDIACIHNPIFTLGELSYFNHCADAGRLRNVFPSLKKFYFYAKNRQGSGSGLYKNACWNNGMDNRPHAYYSVDLTSEQAMVALHLKRIAEIIGDNTHAAQFASEYATLKEVINSKMWSEQDRFYVDVTQDLTHDNNWTVGAFWPLLAHVCSSRQSGYLAESLQDETLFKTPHMVPSLARKSNEYSSAGDYWRGSVWIPTTTMVLKGLDENGYFDIAHDIALNHLQGMYRTWKNHHTFFENYNQENSGKPGNVAKRDFVGWSGVTPIASLIEYVIGIQVKAPENKILWHIRRREEHGIRNLKWGKGWNNTIDLVAERREKADDPLVLNVNSSAPVTLEVDAQGKTYSFQVAAGNNQRFTREGSSIIPDPDDDTSPPDISSVIAHSATSVKVTFTEPVTKESAEKTGNYEITGGIGISGASLQGDNTSVVLTTSTLTEGTTYTLTASAITDRSANANTGGGQKQFRLSGDVQISNLTVASGNSYEIVESIAEGDKQYVDRNYTFSSLGDCAGMYYIRTANDDKEQSGDSFLSFDINSGATVLVAYRHGSDLPPWLSSWSRTGDQVCGDGCSDVYEKDFNAGTVDLGANKPGGAANMYSVFIDTGGNAAIFAAYTVESALQPVSVVIRNVGDQLTLTGFNPHRPYTITLTDTRGRLSIVHSTAGSHGEVSFSTANHPRGVYIVTVSGLNAQHSVRAILR